MDSQRTPISPAKAAAVTAAQYWGLNDVDASTGIGTLDFSGYGDGPSGALRINLIDGSLSALVSTRHTGKEAGDYRLPSPDGNYALLYVEEPRRKIEVVDKKGKKLATIELSEDEDCDAGWSPTSQACYVVSSGLHVYKVGSSRFTRIAGGARDEAQWSSDGRYLACIATGGKKPEHISRFVANSTGIVRVYEFPSFKQVLSTGTLASEIKFSLDGSRIAFLERTKDEYGDYSNYDLRVAEVKARRVYSVLVNRREPKFVWAGNGSIAASSYDKYAVPSVSLIDIATRKQTRLASDRGFALFEPLAYVPSRQLVAYKASYGVTGEKPEELWTVRLGGGPVRLFPKTGGDSHARR